MVVTEGNGTFTPDATVTTGSTTGGSTTYTYPGSCAHRLPCGYCMMLSKACPMQSNTFVTPTWDPNWYKIYCNANANSPNAYYTGENHNYHVSPLTEEKNG